MDLESSSLHRDSWEQFISKVVLVYEGTAFKNLSIETLIASKTNHMGILFLLGKAALACFCSQSYCSDFLGEI